MIGGPWAGTRLAWDRAAMVLGREAVGAAVFRDDGAVSRRHAILRVVDGNCVVEDHGSTNGTFINNVPVDRPTLLGPEDELRIGSTRLRLALAVAGTALLEAVPAETGDGPWDGMASGGPTEPQYGAVTGTEAANGLQARTAGKLSFAIVAAIAGTVLASALNGSPQLRLAAAVVGSAVPAFVTEPGRHQRARVTAAVVLMACALVVTYGGAALFSYVTNHPAIYPVPPVLRPSAHKASPAPAWTSSWPSPQATTSISTPPPTPTVTVTISPSPSPTSSPSTSPTPPPTVSPTPPPIGLGP